MATDDSAPRWSTKNRALVRTVTELLEAGQYEDLAELLDQVRLACEQEGDTLPAHTLDLARRICLACSQSQAEAEWHQQARQEAAQREDKLRHQLNTLLDLAGERNLLPDAPAAVPGLPVPDLPEPVEPPGLRQRLQDLLHRRPGPQPSDLAAPKISAHDAHRLPLVPAQVREVAPEPPSEPEHEAATVALAEKEKRESPGPPSLVVYCLGPFRVYQDEQLTSNWPSGKGKCIFKYMLANRGRPIAKDVLMELFWRGADPDAARNNLNVAIYGLRQALRAARPDFSHILFQDDHYLLNPSMALWVDAEEFLAQYESGRTLERKGRASEAVKEYEVAEGLYQGDFLEEDLYEDWPMLQREGLRDSYLIILERLSRYYLESQRYSICIHLCQKILAKDDCREDAHRRLMRCYCRQGQRHLALRQYHVCAEALQEVLEVAPMEDTATLYHQIRDGLAV